MKQVILLSILFAVVYSWEEIRYSLRVLIYGMLRKDTGMYLASHADEYVGTIVLLATIPIGLSYLLAGPQPFFYKLASLAISLIMIYLLAAGSVIFLKSLTFRREAEQKIIPLAFSVFAFFSPVVRLFSAGYQKQRMVLARFALLLAAPPLIGMAIKLAQGQTPAPEAYLPHQDALTALLVGALFIRITIEFLEYYFRLFRLESLFSYFRILLGIALAVVMLGGLGGY